jgi:hypothetical protein
LILLVSHGGSRNLGGHAGFFQPGIRCNETNFIHANTPSIRNCRFQLFGKFSGFCFARGKCVDKLGELSLGDLLGELHTGKSGRGK